MSTKEKILDAALTLFAENGYDGIGKLPQSRGEFIKVTMERISFTNFSGMTRIVSRM